MLLNLLEWNKEKNKGSLLSKISFLENTVAQHDPNNSYFLSQVFWIVICI